MRIQLNELLFSLSRALDCVEHEILGITVNHSKRAAYMAMRVCAWAGASKEDIFDMASCAILHDNALTEYVLRVGEHNVPHLKNIEYHCRSGENNARSFPFLGDTRNIILHHHENWDGSGFFGICGEALSLRAMALRLADNLDLLFALGSQDAEVAEKVRTHLQQEREALYHPELTDAFLRLLDQGILDNLRDERIDASLAESMPDFVREIPSDTMLQACSVFASIIDSRSRFTLRHTMGIAEKVAIMAEDYGFSEEHTDKLVIAAYLHDIGKLTVPKSILEKNGPLDNAEFSVMKGHALASYSILHGVRGLEDVALWAPSHHEKLDGSGYPFGKQGSELCKECRLLACVDIYQALTEDRPYRAGMSHEKSMKILQDMASKGKLDGGIVQDLERIFGQAGACPISFLHVPMAPLTAHS